MRGSPLRSAGSNTTMKRLTRFYEYGGTRFIVVFEPAERNGEPRIIGIYLP
jgi:hypothetical protein